MIAEVELITQLGQDVEQENKKGKRPLILKAENCVEDRFSAFVERSGTKGLPPPYPLWILEQLTSLIKKTKLRYYCY